MDALEVFTLGTPKILWQAEQVQIPRRQARALFYYLAVAPAPVPAVRLSFLFWADSPEREARRNLSRLCSSLRSCLPLPNPLVKSGGAIWLDSARVQSDYRRFQSAFQHQAYKEAADLYSAEFLYGLELPRHPEYERWLSRERRTLQRDYLSALRHLASQTFSQGDLHRAEGYAKQFLETDQLDEEIHRLLIEIYARTGDRNAALRQYEYCTLLLEQELGVSPLPETQAAIQNALNQNKTTPRGQTISHRKPVSLPRIPLIGRQRELDQLLAFHQRTLAGEGGLMAISGEAGIGKSRLLQEFAASVQKQVFVLATTCDPGMHDLPYHLLRNVLQALLETLPQAFDALGDEWKRELFLLLPDLRMRYPHLPMPYSHAPREVQNNISEAVCRLFEYPLRESNIFLLLVEDLHDADNASISCLYYLHTRLHNVPLEIIYTFRQHESQVVERLHNSYAADAKVETIRLSPLSEEDIITWLEWVNFPPSVIPSLSQKIHYLSGGNPLYISQLINNLMESEDPQRLAGQLDEIEVGGSLKQIIDRRLKQLSDYSRQILETISVLGYDCNYELLARISGRELSNFSAGMQELIGRQLIQQTAGGFCFSHAIILKSVYQSLKPWRRKLLHRRSAETLFSFQPEDAARIGYHYQHAGEPISACKAYLQASERLESIFAYSEMHSYLENCLELLAEAESKNHTPDQMEEIFSLRLQILRQRGWVYRRQGEIQKYLQDLHAERQINHLLQNDLEQAYLHWREASTHRWLCNFPAALSAAQEGLQLSRKINDQQTQANCLRESGLVHRAIGDFDTAQWELEKAFEIFTRLKSWTTQIHVLGNLSTLHRWNGDLTKAEQIANQALELCEIANLPLERRVPLGILGVIAIEKGDYPFALSCLEESLEIAEKIDHYFQELFCRGHLGRLYARLEDTQKAQTSLEKALDFAKQEHFCAERSWLHRAAAEVCVSQGEFEAAGKHLHAAEEFASLIGQAHELELIQAQLQSLPT